MIGSGREREEATRLAHTLLSIYNSTFDGAWYDALRAKVNETDETALAGKNRSTIGGIEAPIPFSPGAVSSFPSRYWWMLIRGGLRSLSLSFSLALSFSFSFSPFISVSLALVSLTTLTSLSASSLSFHPQSGNRRDFPLPELRRGRGNVEP